MSWGEEGFSALLAGGYLAVMTLGWLGLIWGAGTWGRGWRLERREVSSRPLPRLSICIPARNESESIGSCVRAALAQDYPNLEVLVCDDRSDDDTADQALSAAGGDPRFRLIAGEEPAAGWAGKPWACHRLSREAEGEILVFVDADVQLATWTISAAVEEKQERGAALLSLFGDWDLRSFWETTVIPVVGWLIRGTVNLDEVNNATSATAFANGQFILVDRKSYERVGGHGVVRAEVLEDVRLAKAFKTRAMRTVLLHAPGAFRVRLYSSLSEIVSGYQKNLYEGLDRRLSLGLGAILFVFVGTLLPFLLLIGLLMGKLQLGWAFSEVWLVWLGVLCALVPIFRWRIERADGRSGWFALTHLLGNVVLVWILLRAIFSLESEWKGRKFVDGKAEASSQK